MGSTIRPVRSSKLAEEKDFEEFRNALLECNFIDFEQVLAINFRSLYSNIRKIKQRMIKKNLMQTFP